MKTKVYKKYYGLEYVTVKMPLVKLKKGWGVEAETLRDVENSVSKEILTRKIPLRGKEVKFIRKSFDLSARSLGELLGISHVAVLKWEKSPNKRLELINAIAVRAVLANYAHIHLSAQSIVIRDDLEKTSMFQVKALGVA